MPRYDAQKNPFGQRLRQLVNKKINDQLQRQAKAIPCHVTKVDKDFVTVAFETHDNNLTPPTVKIPQSFSPYAREPTQVGDKGYAVPSDYYLGGNTGLAGGATNYYPRSNLSPLSFQPLSQTTNAERDYDQYTVTGGPQGLMFIQNADKPQQQGQGSPQAASPGTQALSLRQAGIRPQRLTRAIPGQGFYVSPAATAPPANGGGPAPPTGGAQATTTNKSRISIDSSGTAITQDGTQKYRTTVDAPHLRTTVEAPVNTGKVFIGGDGKEGAYALLLTVSGPCKHSYGRLG